MAMERRLHILEGIDKSGKAPPEEVSQWEELYWSPPLCLSDMFLYKTHDDTIEDPMTVIPKSIGLCTQLKRLTAAWHVVTVNSIDFRMGLDSLPTSFFSLQNLEELDLSWNSFSTIADEIDQLTKLRVLNLNKNRFSSFPVSICHLPLLEKLILSNNVLEGLHLDIGKLTKLKIFNVANNKIDKFPPLLCSLEAIEELNLNDNLLLKLPPEFSSMANIRMLKLSGNNFLDFPSPVCNLTALQELDLAWNRITTIPLTISQLKNLVSFKLHNNRLSILPKALRNLKKLHYLGVCGNPITFPPQSVCVAGTSAILSYLRGSKDLVLTTATKLQLNLLGCTCAGKSSLAQSLTQQTSCLTAEADRTKVIDQLIWTLPEEVVFNINDFGGHNVYTVVHPFFISPTAVSLVVFDLSTCDLTMPENYGKHIGSWIERLGSHAPHTLTLLVGTHADQCNDETKTSLCSEIATMAKEQLASHNTWLQHQIDRIDDLVAKAVEAPNKSALMTKRQKLLQMQAEQISIHDVVFPVSSKTLDGFQELETTLISIAKENGASLPSIWWKVARSIEKVDRDFLTMDQVLELYKSQVARSFIFKLLPSRAKKESAFKDTIDILRHLSGSGDIVWYEKNTSLSDIIFHKVEVIANLLKVVLDHDMKSSLTFESASKVVPLSAPKFQEMKEDLLKRGIISRNLMEILWKPFALGKTEMDAMIGLLQTLDLCYEVRVKDGIAQGGKAVDVTAKGEGAEGGREDPGSAGDATRKVRIGHSSSQDENQRPEESTSKDSKFGEMNLDDVAYHFPWLLTENCPADLQEYWSPRVAEFENQLTLELYFPRKCPDGLYERFTVRLHRYLGLFRSERVDWKDGVFAKLPSVTMLLNKELRQKDRVITVACRGRHLPDLWIEVRRAHDDLMGIIEEDWPGLPFDKYLKCPHCVKSAVEEPKLFPGEILNSPPPVERNLVPCHNKGGDGLIPANLVYPTAEDHNPMSKMNIEALKKNRPDLVKGITAPCLKNALRRFKARDIYTEDEVSAIEGVAVIYDRVGAFLDVLKRKEQRAFYHFCQVLIENRASHLADLIKS